MVVDNRPFISSEGVRSALDNLLYTSRSNPVEALQRLTLVDEILADPAIPNFENAREFAVNNLLTQYIIDELQRLRRILSLATPTYDTQLQEEIHHIQQDGATQASNLIAWSYLYYRYVRVDLNISPETYARYVQMDVRTLRRYLDKGIKALTDKLAAAEWDARARLRQRRLYNMLPIATPVTLFGRDEALLRADQVFRQTERPRHLLISGAPGSGKTTFAQEAVRHQINDLRAPVAYVIWQDHPTNLDDVLQFITAQLYVEDVSLDLRDYLAHYRTIIVLDQVNRFEIAELERLLTYLSSAEVICISDQFISLKAPITHITMTELDDSATYEYIASFNLGTSTHEIQSYAAAIRAYAGGNPLAIKLAADAILLDADLDPQKMIAALFSQRFEAMDTAIQCAWVTFALLPERGIQTEDICKIWHEIKPVHLTTLARQHILQLTPDDCFVLTTAARLFIQQNAEPLYALIEQQLGFLLRIPPVTMTECYLSIIEELLFREFPMLPQAVEARWLSDLDKYQHKNMGRWLAILERKYRRYAPQDKGYHLAYGRLLRRLNRWETAQLVIEQVIAVCGTSGDFSLQAEAMIELAILLRIRGNMPGARQLLEKSAQIARRYREARLIQQSYLELAQLEIDLNDSGAALYHLQDLDNVFSGRVFALFAEAMLLQTQYQDAIHHAMRALRHYVDDRVNYAITAVLLGRVYYAAQEYPLAHQHITLAITILETENYPFALARARMNMALVLIQQGETDNARHLLRQAEAIQQDLRDAIGLAITRHNLEWLENH